MRKILLIVAFAFAACLAFADPQYYFISFPGGGMGYTYGYPSSPADLVPVIAPGAMDGGDGQFFDPSADAWGGIYPATPEYGFNDPASELPGADGFPYYPSNPAYADYPVAPANDPLVSSPSGGGGDPASGGGDSSGLPSYMEGMDSALSAIALAVAGVLTAAALIYIIFLCWRQSKKGFNKF